jgi:hypothetical protein
MNEETKKMLDQWDHEVLDEETVARVMVVIEELKKMRGVIAPMQRRLPWAPVVLRGGRCKTK